MGDWDLKSRCQVDLEDSVASLRYQLEKRSRELQHLRRFIMDDHKIMAKYARFVLNGRSADANEKESEENV